MMTHQNDFRFVQIPLYLRKLVRFGRVLRKRNLGFLKSLNKLLYESGIAQEIPRFIRRHSKSQGKIVSKQVEIQSIGPKELTWYLTRASCSHGTESLLSVVVVDQEPTACLSYSSRICR